MILWLNKTCNFYWGDIVHFPGTLQKKWIVPIDAAQFLWQEATKIPKSLKIDVRKNSATVTICLLIKNSHTFLVNVCLKRTAPPPTPAKKSGKWNTDLNQWPLPMSNAWLKNGSWEDNVIKYENISSNTMTSTCLMSYFVTQLLLSKMGICPAPLQIQSNLSVCATWGGPFGSNTFKYSQKWHVSYL